MIHPADFFADDDWPASLSLEECRQQLQSNHLSDAERVLLLYRVGQLLVERRAYAEALSSLNRALRLQPNHAQAQYYRAQALEGIGAYSDALLTDDCALACLPSLDCDIAAQIWNHRGNLLRTLKRYPEALDSYNQALALQPNFYSPLSNRGVVLAMLKRYPDALMNADRAMELQPDSSEVWNNRGMILLMAGRTRDALKNFDRALELQPDFDRAWNNRAIALARLGQDAEALISLEHALHTSTSSHQPWHASSWTFHGFLLMKAGRFKRAIASYEKAQAVQPNSYPAAFYKVLCSLLTGQLLKDLSRPETRTKLGQDFKIVSQVLRNRLLFLIGLIGAFILGQYLLNTYAQGTWIEDAASRLIPMVLSVGIITLIVADLWRNKSKLHFVWTTYFRSGILTYVRAIGIIIATLTTFELSRRVVPPFMMWGWANWVFGQPGNVILQPLFNLLESVHPDRVSEIAAGITPVSHLLGVSVSGGPGAIAPALMAIPFGVPNGSWLTEINYTVLFISSFWLLLILGIPFWARLEERIFRQGANTWKQICIRSTQFGLIHLLAGIPILGGFVLIVPGFLFACRYKYVYERHLKRYSNPIRAQEAGVIASTADHAVYNAILITILVSTLLLANDSI